MLIFDELEEINKIKIYNKYAYYPKVNYFKKILTEKARIYHGIVKILTSNQMIV